MDLAEVTRRVPFIELVALAGEKDPGLDLEVLAQFMARVHVMRPESFGLDRGAYQALVAQVDGWHAHIGDLLARQRGTPRPGPGHGLSL